MTRATKINRNSYFMTKRFCTMVLIKMRCHFVLWVKVQLLKIWEHDLRTLPWQGNSTVSCTQVDFQVFKIYAQFQGGNQFCCNSLLHELLELSYAQHNIQQILISPWTSHFFMNVAYVSLLKYNQPRRLFWI